MPGTVNQPTIDVFAAEYRLRMSLLKIDTDGHEFAVLSGATESLRRFRPVVVFEACEYLLRPPRATFDDFTELFRQSGYNICHGSRLRRLTYPEFYATCPRGGGVDLVAIPAEALRDSAGLTWR